MEKNKENLVLASSWVACFLLEAVILCAISIHPGWTLAVFLVGLSLAFGSGWVVRSHYDAKISKPQDGPVIDVEAK